MKTTRAQRIVALAISLIAFSTHASAQDPVDWGPNAPSGVTGGHPAVSRRSPVLPHRQASTVGLGAVCPDFVTACKAGGGFSLPTGARIVGVDLEACDSAAGGEARVELFACSGTNPNSGCTTVANVTTGLAAQPGCTTVSSGALNVTVQNATTSYPLIATVNDNSIGVLFRAVRIRYMLQVSPAPGVATFADVPVGSPLHPFVEALAASGITGGCGGGNYCPDAPLTRGQMAVFLAAALGLHWPN
jgi:hypothetical protein